MIDLSLLKLSLSLCTRMSLGYGGRAKTKWFCVKYLSKFFWKVVCQVSHFLMTLWRKFTKFKYILCFNFWTLKVPLLIYLVVIQGTPIDLKYLLSRILKMQYKYLTIFLEGKGSIQILVVAFRYKFISLISFEFLLLLFLNRL